MNKLKKFRRNNEKAELERLRKQNDYAQKTITHLNEGIHLQEVEIRRLKAGQFTKEEINDICHDLHGTVDAREFAAGCAMEQRMLYGCAPDADEVARLREALEESVKLQSHYGTLLNMHDGGQRITFDSADAWLARLEELKQRKEQEPCDISSTPSL